MILHMSALCLISYLRTVCSLSKGLEPFADATRRGAALFKEGTQKEASFSN